MFDRFVNSGTGGYSDEERRGAQGSTASVHDLVPVQTMFGNVMVLKDGSYRMVLKVGSVNFELKSDREKMNLLASYGSLLNTLQVDFPMQLLLHSTHMDTEAYVREYRERLLDPSVTPQMRVVIEDHIAFFEEQARNNYLLDRAAFVVVPFWDRNVAPTGDGGVAQESMPLGGALSRLLDGSASEKKNVKTRRDMEKAKIQLTNRCNMIASGLQRLNIQAQILDELALVRLLREMYNPALAERQRMRDGFAPNRGGLIQTVRTDRQRGRASGRPQLPPGGAR